MKVVALADTHMFHEELVVPEGDVLVHAGDLCRVGDLEELAEGLEWLGSLPHPHKLLVAGNHDWAFANQPGSAQRLAARHNITYLQDEDVVVDGIHFWGSPWQPCFNDWAFNLPRGPELAARWALIPDTTRVLITHGPPLGIGDGTSVANRHGCADLRRRVNQVQPWLHVFGHIHEDGGAWHEGNTVFVNATTWECERGATVLDLDPVSGTIHLCRIPPCGC